jgi:hypothetical protein
MPIMLDFFIKSCQNLQNIYIYVLFIIKNKIKIVNIQEFIFYFYIYKKKHICNFFHIKRYLEKINEKSLQNEVIKIN